MAIETCLEKRQRRKPNKGNDEREFKVQRPPVGVGYAQV